MSADTVEKRKVRRDSADSETDEYLKDVAGFLQEVGQDVTCTEEELHWSDIGEFGFLHKQDRCVFESKLSFLSLLA